MIELFQEFSNEWSHRSSALNEIESDKLTSLMDEPFWWTTFLIDGHFFFKWYGHTVWFSRLNCFNITWRFVKLSKSHLTKSQPYTYRIRKLRLYVIDCMLDFSWFTKTFRAWNHVHRVNQIKMVSKILDHIWRRNCVPTDLPKNVMKQHFALLAILSLLFLVK